MSSAADVDDSCRYSELPVLTAVELPFFSSSSASAVSILGGEDTVHNIIREEGKQLYARFPSQNALQSSLVGARTGTGGALVLRFRRKKNGNGHTQVDVVGRVDHAYVFRQPADYQFLPESAGLQLLHTNQNSTAMAVSTGSAGTLISIYYH